MSHNRCCAYLREYYEIVIVTKCPKRITFNVNVRLYDSYVLASVCACTCASLLLLTKQYFYMPVCVTSPVFHKHNRNTHTHTHTYRVRDDYCALASPSYIYFVRHNKKAYLKTIACRCIIGNSTALCPTHIHGPVIPISYT
jgi:hypothetical protein